MPEWLLQIFLAGAVYGGIRSDLKSAISCANEAKAGVVKAHERIDNILQNNQ